MWHLKPFLTRSAIAAAKFRNLDTLHIRFARQFIALSCDEPSNSLAARNNSPCLPSPSTLLTKPSHSNQLLVGRALNSRRSYCDGTSESDEEATSFHVQDFDDFQARVLSSPVPVIVDFHADWCGPCKLLGPRLESQIDSREGRVLLAKVDVDDNAEIAMDYNVASIPHVVSFKDGKVVDQFIGVQEDEAIETFLDKVDSDF